MRSVGVLSLGCKVNAYEGEFVINKLKENGYVIKDFNDVCDVYIINTCSVTNTSDIKSKKMIRSAIKRNHDACVVAMGCFIESHKDYNVEGLDIVIGNKDKSRIVEILDEYFDKKEQIRRLYSEEKNVFENMYIESFPGRTRAFVKIQDGCENYCSYCIIPYVRGKCRSKDSSLVIDEIKSLVNNGYKEIVLTGIHTGNYGVDINVSFADLLREIVKIPGLERLRISSIEVTELTDEVLDIILKSDIIVNHLHIPLQAGSNEVLKLMNRKYDLDYYYDKIKKLRSIKKDISITTDIIVGFPGESEEMFEETCRNAYKFEFTKIHVFPYSLRTGTKAVMMPGHISGDVKKQRARKLLNISKDLECKYMEKFIGRDVVVLTENYKDGYTYGHTSNYLYVKIGRMIDSNTLISVKVIDICYPYIIAE